MHTPDGVWRRWRARFLTGLLAPGVFALSGPASFRAAEWLAAPAAVAPAPVAPLPADLAGLRQLSLERQPSLAAYRASVAAAEERVHGLDQLRFASLVRRDLPARREQAAQGLCAAEAQLNQATWDTLYAVTRTYLSAAYARLQLDIADKALQDKVTGLSFLRSVADRIYKDGTRPDVKKWNVDQIDLLTQTTEGQRVEAADGVKRALAALREAVGIDGDCPLSPALVLPPVPDVKPTCPQIVELALARRGEVAQAAAGFEVTSLEVKAQSALWLRSQAQTFASGADIHVTPIPQGIANSEYRPGAIGIEMPPTMTGFKSARVGQAEALNGRAGAVLQKTRQLITLEAEAAYLKWERAAQEYAKYQQAAKTAREVAEAVRKSFKETAPANDRPTLDDLVNTRVRAVQMEVLVNQARYDVLLALAALERVTAGGFCPGFEGVPPAPAGRP
jgi:outer membrane protein TolC